MFYKSAVVGNNGHRQTPLHNIIIGGGYECSIYIVETPPNKKIYNLRIHINSEY